MHHTLLDPLAYLASYNTTVRFVAGEKQLSFGWHLPPERQYRLARVAEQYQKLLQLQVETEDGRARGVHELLAQGLIRLEEGRCRAVK